MDLSERIKLIRQAEGLGRTLFSRKTGIRERTLQGMEQRGSTPNGDTLAAVCTHFPQYTLWLMTGKSDPISGQISPEIENQRGAINSQ
jgi:transcriptional regulator with XRE-family HTH domain